MVVREEKKDQTCPVKVGLALKYLQRSNPNLWPPVDSIGNIRTIGMPERTCSESLKKGLLMPVKYRLINLVREEKGPVLPGKLKTGLKIFTAF